MSTLRISNIEAKSVPASATIDEKVKITNSSGDPLVFIDGKTSGITTVGINTTDPNITFDANSNVVVTGIITATKFSGQFEPTSVGIADSIFHTGDTDTSIRFPSADSISFRTANLDRLRIEPDGVVLIGHNASRNVGYEHLVQLESTNTAPHSFSMVANRSSQYGANFDMAKSRSSSVGGSTIVQDDDILSQIVSRGADGTDVATVSTIIRSSVDGTPASNDIPGRIEFHTSTGGTAHERLRIDAFGRVLIGETSAIIASSAEFSEIVLGGKTRGAGITLQDVDANTRFQIRTDDAGGDPMTLMNASTNHPIAIRTNNVERVRIHSSGNVGIGVTNPNAKLHLASGSSSAVGDSTNPALQIGSTTNYRMGAYTTNEGAIIANKNGDDGIIFHTKTGTSAGSFGEGCRITSAGNLKFISGKGIDFSATSDASGMSNELLEDYEEGSWTPTILGWDTFTHYSGSSYYAGWYVKVGNMVHCGWKIYYQNLSTPSSNAHIRISGLPYAAKTISAGPNCHIRFDIPDFSFSGYPVPYLAGNETTIGFYKQVSGSNNISAINATSNYSNNWTMGTATYATN